MARIAGCPLVKMSASFSFIRITSSGVIIGRAISGSDVLAPLLDTVRCE